MYTYVRSGIHILHIQSVKTIGKLFLSHKRSRDNIASVSMLANLAL